MKNFLKYILTIAFFFTSAASFADDTEGLPLADKQLIAEYLERFTRFIDWPDGASFNKPAKPFILGIYGRNPFGDILLKEFDDTQIKGADVIIKQIPDIKGASDCHMLFVTGVEKNELKKLIKSLKKKPILTVSNTPGFAVLGVHINLYFSQNKLQFEINDNAVRQSGLKMSYLLLLQAKLIKN